jgi:hypothetical protein
MRARLSPRAVVVVVAMLRVVSPHNISDISTVRVLSIDFDRTSHYP